MNLSDRSISYLKLMARATKWLIVNLEKESTEKETGQLLDVVIQLDNVLEEMGYTED